MSDQPLAELSPAGSICAISVRTKVVNGDDHDKCEPSAERALQDESGVDGSTEFIRDG
jgi:hypothetical protein